MKISAYIFDWGNTLMIDDPNESGPMYQWTQVSLCPYVVETLSALSSHTPCYLATNAKDSSKEDIRMALQRVEISSFITDIFCYREIGFKKPSSEYFRCMLDCLALPVNELLVVGDDPVKDYQWAIDNGAQAILYSPNQTAPIPGVKSIRDLKELLSL